MEIKKKYLPIWPSESTVFQSSLHLRKKQRVNPMIKETVPPDQDANLQSLTGNAGSELKFCLTM